MGVRRMLVAAGGLLAALGVSAAFAATGGVSWGKAVEVPGTAALNTTGWAGVSSISCRAAGKCSAGGYYQDDNYITQSYVVDEQHGTWGNVVQIPGLAALEGPGGGAMLHAFTCGSAGNCVAGGSYNNGNHEAFVADEKNGVWGNAIEVPGTDALNVTGNADVSSISCSSAGNCVAGGTYQDANYAVQPFVADETNGVWGNAIELPGTAGWSSYGIDNLESVSCRGVAGNCIAGGYYLDGGGYSHAWVADEKNGVWGAAVEVPGMSALSVLGQQNVSNSVNTVSCGSPGNCSAGGDYFNNGGNAGAFIAVEKNYVWGNAVEVPGTDALNVDGEAAVNSISCPAAGKCAAARFYVDATDTEQGFLVSEKSGVWGTAIKVPIAAALGATGSFLRSISCGTVGNCAAGGSYVDAHGYRHALVVGEKNGVWHKGVEVPSTAGLNLGGNAAVSSVSCPSTGKCGLGGGYADAQYGNQAFVTSP